MKKFKFVLSVMFVMVTSVALFATGHVIPGLMFTGGVVVSMGIPQTNVAYASAFNLTTLTTNLGAYCREYRDAIFTQALLGFDGLDNIWTTYDGVNDELPLPNLSSIDIVQPMVIATDTFAPIDNALVFGSRTLKVRPWKVDLLLNPELIRATWLGMTRPAAQSSWDMGTLEGAIVNEIIQRIKENIRMKILYKGVFGAGSTPGLVTDGLLKQITDAIAAGETTPVATGAITSVNVIAKLKLVHAGLGASYKNTKTFMLVSSEIFDWYYDAQYPAGGAAFTAYNKDTFDAITTGMGYMNAIPLNGTNCVVIREPGMGTSQRVILTTKGNLCYGTSTADDITNMEIEKFNRSLKVMIDGRIGVNFAYSVAGAVDRNMVVNDQV